MSEQTELLQAMLAILEEMKAQRTDVKPSHPSEVALEALSRSITPFTHAPEQNLTFDTWFERYKHTFLEDGKNLDDASRVRLLLRRLDAVSYEKYSSNLLPRNPAELTFVDTVEILTKLFGRGESLFCTRRKCFQLVIRDSDDLTTHAGIVNRQCEASRLTECTPDHFKSLIFVLSLQSEKYVLVREQLLTKFETEPPEKITLDFMLEEARRLLNIKSDSKVDSGAANVNALRKSFPAKKERPPRPCYLCGSMHFVRDCPHTATKCADCHKIGHKTGYCPPAKDNDDRESHRQKGNSQRNNFTHKRQKPRGKKPAKMNAIFSNKRFGRKYLSARINDHPVEFQLDCAADLSMISRDTWVAIGRPPLTASTITVRDAQAGEIPVEGEFQCRITLLGKEICGRCIVSSSTHSNLFGIEWIEDLGLWDLAPNAFCNTVKRDLDTTQAVRELQAKFPIVFSPEMGLCTEASGTIHLKSDATPIFRPKRPVAFHMASIIDEELERLQSSGIITPVEFSQWAAPIVVARKPNGKIRICGDYSTGLNESVETNNYPIPDPDSLFSRLSGNKIFSHVDLSDAYLQIPVDEESSKLLTIHTHRGLFRFNRLPPGIRSAPGIFQEIVERMLQGIPGVISYFDDICVASTNAEEHFSTLQAVFQRLQDFNFRVKLEKCKFFAKEIKFLGIVADQEGLHPDPAKVEAINNMPAPRNVQELRSFLGAVQFWGKFVDSMSHIRVPLDRLLKKNVRWNWSRECENSFQRFKEILKSDLLLTHYNPKLPILVASDASSYAIGCVAYHEFPDGSLKAFYHASRKLTDTEAKYSQVEKEGLGLTFAVKKFHRFIYGRKFTLLTDHKPLVSIFGSKKGIPVHTANRLQRWALILLGYEFDIKYTATGQFGHADVLSRLISSQRRRQEDEVIIALIDADISIDSEIARDVASHLPVDFKMIQRASQTSPALQEVARYITGGWPSSRNAIQSGEVSKFYKIRDALSLIKGCVFYRERLVIPEAFRTKVLTQLHEAHPGMARMKSLARGYVFWPGMDSAIEHRVRNCQECATASKTPVKSHLASWPLTSRCWQRIHIDYAKYKNDYYLLIVDAFSKWPEVYKTSSMTTAVTVAKLRECFARHGLPEILVSDNGTQFTNAAFADYCKQNGIKHIRTAPYSPASNGQCERFVDTLKRSLEKQKSLPADVALQQFLANYRATPNENSPQGKSPSEVIYGRKVHTVLDLLKVPSDEPIRRNEKMEAQYNRHHGTKARSFARGEEVYAKIFAQGGVKFTWTPGKIIERRGSAVYNVRLCNGTLIRSHINQLKRRFSDENRDSGSLPLPTTSRNSHQYNTRSHSRQIQSPATQRTPLRPKTERLSDPIVISSGSSYGTLSNADESLLSPVREIHSQSDSPGTPLNAVSDSQGAVGPALTPRTPDAPTQRPPSQTPIYRRMRTRRNVQKRLSDHY